MTREVQIELASGRFAYMESRPACCRASFEKGAEWADANRWVKVEDGLPEPGQRIAFKVQGGSYDGSVFGGKYGGKPFGTPEASTPGMGFNFSMWAPISEPPKAEQ